MTLRQNLIIFIMLYGYSCSKCRLQTHVYSSGLCQPPKLKYNTSCHMQLPSPSENDNCLFTFEKNTSNCHSLKFETNKIKNKLHNLKLKVYQFNNKAYVLPAFNVTFTDILWTDFSLRYKLENEENICIYFHIKNHQHLPTSWTLFYDCAWYSELIEGKSILMEYKADFGDQIESRRYTFISPHTKKIGLYEKPECNDIKSFQTLTYMDLSVSPKIELHIQVLPPYFEVEQYEIKQCFCTECKFGQIDTCISILFINISLAEEEIIVPLNIAEESGIFFYAIFAHGDNCSSSACYISHTSVLKGPYIIINKIVKWSSILLPIIFIFGLIIYVLLKKTIIKLSRKGNNPKILLLHQPLFKGHLEVVSNLVEFLENGQIDVLFDIRDIIGTQEQDKNLESWYRLTISRVDIIAVISSPPYAVKQESSRNSKVLDLQTRYQDLQTLGLKILEDKIPKKSIIVLILPYCNESGIPELVRNKRRFELKKQDDFYQLISFIHNHQVDCNDCNSLMKGQTRVNTNYLNSKSIKLWESIKKMETIVKQDEFTSNISIFHSDDSCLLKLKTIVLEKETIEQESDVKYNTRRNYLEFQNGFNISDLNLSGQRASDLSSLSEFS